jgi:hypothetical protein
MKLLGLGVARLRYVNIREIVEGLCDIWIVRPERLFADRQGTFVERFGLAVAALRLIGESEKIERCGNIRVVRAESPFAKPRRPFERLGSMRIVAALVKLASLLKRCPEFFTRSGVSGRCSQAHGGAENAGPQETTNLVEIRATKNHRLPPNVPSVISARRRLPPLPSGPEILQIKASVRLRLPPVRAFFKSEPSRRSLLRFGRWWLAIARSSIHRLISHSGFVTLPRFTCRQGRFATGRPL